MVKRLLYILVVALMLAGCGHERLIYVPGPVTRDTVVERVLSKDTLLVHDSTFVDRYVQGDTVIVSKVRDRVVYRAALRVDTMYKATHDTITVAEQVEVPAELSAYDRMSMVVGRWLVPIFLIVIAFIVGRVFVKK